jgi:hypothetical protein
VRARIIRGLRRARLWCVAGETFLHANGVRDRAWSIARVRSIYERGYGCLVLLVGLATSLYDLAFLRRVDLPIVVRSERSTTTEILATTSADGQSDNRHRCRWLVGERPQNLSRRSSKLW